MKPIAFPGPQNVFHIRYEIPPHFRPKTKPIFRPETVLKPENSANFPHLPWLGFGHGDLLLLFSRPTTSLDQMTRRQSMYQLRSFPTVLTCVKSTRLVFSVLYFHLFQPGQQLNKLSFPFRWDKTQINFF